MTDYEKRCVATIIGGLISMVFSFEFGMGVVFSVIFFGIKNGDTVARCSKMVECTLMEQLQKEF